MPRQIPGAPPFQPPIPGPEIPPPATGNKYTIGSEYKESFPYAVLTHEQYWKLIYFYDVECGSSWTYAVATEIGVSVKAVEEFTTALEAKDVGLSAKLSTKLGITIEIKTTKSSSTTVNVTTGPCEGASIAVWQLVDEFTLTVFGLFSETTYRLTVPEDIYDEDVRKYNKPECCPEKIAPKTDEPK